METISQMASSAMKATFGETKNEPLSGAQGDVSRGEPYDAGNLGTLPPKTHRPSLHLTEYVDASEQERIRQNLNKDEAGDLDSSDAAYTTGPRDTSTTDAAPGQDVPKSHNTGPVTTATNQADESGFTRPNVDMSAPGRSTSDDVPAGGGVTTSTNRTTDSGFTSPGQDMGGSSSSSSNFKLPPADDQDAPVDVSGPGPRDVADVARENGGNAAVASPSHSSGGKSASSGAKDATSDNAHAAAAADDGGKDKGTGELYVKSSGLKADGGDFDATKPGAGREADRLMEEKGISTTSSDKKSGGGGGGGGEGDAKSHGSGGSGSGDKEKHSIVDKIKEKLHKH